TSKKSYQKISERNTIASPNYRKNEFMRPRRYCAARSQDRAIPDTAAAILNRSSDMKIFQREATKCDLASQVLRSTGELRLRALGLSMLPSLWPGDILSIQSCTFEDVARGDIVLCSREGQFVIHRIVGKSEDRQFLIT